ncbi:MAG: diaminopimelate epimerase [Rubrivivax sp. SCN 71-131]|jgi:diaminopimelate epimerase|nr:MAG: diaminopimelate epimerase [Rubrivivax sp. SCN 71-131]
MRVRFTKMQGTGNDFVVLDATRAPLRLAADQVQRLGDRRLGVGADQILVVESPSADEHEEGIDFRYRIFNAASGAEVEHCGNGARCFVRFVHEHGLSSKPVLRVATVNNRIELQMQPDGRVAVDMNVPQFAPENVPFDGTGLRPRLQGAMPLWPLEVHGRTIEAAVLSMGNPHAVLRVEDVTTAPVAELGPRIECHPRFPRKVNVGFMQVVGRGEIALRVHERDAGETLACGTGACAAVVAGIRQGLLDAQVDVHVRGGRLTVAWGGGDLDHVRMTGAAETVFEGEIEL